jgi:cell division protein ZapA
VSAEPAPVTVRILDKEYQVACPPDEHDALLESARLLDEKMREIRDTGRIVGLERIAIMTALNLANELLSVRTEHEQTIVTMQHRLQSLSDRADQVLENARQMEL